MNPGGPLRAARTSVAQARAIVVALLVALLSGALLGAELVPSYWFVIGVFVIMFFAWVALVASFETAILCLIGSVVFQNYLTLDFAFWVTPAYVLSSILFLRLIFEGRYSRVRAPMDGAVGAWLLLGVLSIPVASLFGTALPRVAAGIQILSYHSGPFRSSVPYLSPYCRTSFSVSLCRAIVIS